MALTKTSYSMITGAPVNVLDYGAKGDGVTDDTAAFNAAIATGKKVYVPIPSGAGYVVNNITVITNTVIEGEKSGISNGPTLIVTTSNSAAFRHTTSAVLYQIEIRNFVVKPLNTSLVNTQVYKQDNTSTYTAYAKFENIESYLDFTTSYDGFFIFTDWVNCRDGYVGNPNTSGKHTFIKCLPAAWGQGNQANINSIKHCKVFRAFGDVAALDIGYGVDWYIELTDFENLDVQAVNAQGIYNIKFQSCWFEGIAAAQVGTFTASPAPAIGTRPVIFSDCHFHVSQITTYIATLGAASRVGFTNCTFSNVPSGLLLSNSVASMAGLDNLVTLSGAGAAGLFSGFNTTQ